MSGIVGLLNLDGGPVIGQVLRDLTASLAFRGPDAQHTWLGGEVGFGLAVCNVAPGDPATRPFGSCNELSILADARLDGRDDLAAALQSRTLRSLACSSDAELILCAYQIWGDNCLDHLMGDFSFAIWDGARRRLFCGRDQMGVKPFFYAHVGSLLIFSNTLDCIRQHPAVSDRLNDLSIADFLLFDLIQDPSATAFANIQRLPPAHSLSCEGGRLSVRRYWEPSVTQPVNYRHPSDYVERFKELLDASVADRLRSGSACIFMSGGLDSPTVAASAARVSARPGQSCSLWAHTQVFDSLIPHEERRYAGLVAQALKIPIEYRADDDLRLFQFAEDPDYSAPEPVHTAWPDVTGDQLRRVSKVSRVVLTGYGADPLFSSRISIHFRELLRQRRFGRALTDAVGYFAAEGRLSRLYLRTRWRILFAQKEAHGGFFPPWLDEDFTQKFNLRDRWENFTANTVSREAVRPEALEFTFAPFWPDLFNAHDPGVTRVPVEVRHPFFDLRLMNYLLALPRLPWCCDKHLLREAARGVLPEPVRLRRKSPLKVDPLLKLLSQPGAVGASRFDPVPELCRYVNPHAIPQTLETTEPWSPWVHLRPLSLNYWLRALSPSLINGDGGVEYELSSTRHP